MSFACPVYPIQSNQFNSKSDRIIQQADYGILLVTCQSLRVHRHSHHQVLMLNPQKHAATKSMLFVCTQLALPVAP